jgi:hypothetical protein
MKYILMMSGKKSDFDRYQPGSNASGLVPIKGKTMTKPMTGDSRARPQENENSAPGDNGER